MNTKEAIEFLKLYKLEAINILKSGFEGWRFDNIISLLQQEEKDNDLLFKSRTHNHVLDARNNELRKELDEVKPYREMWEELSCLGDEEFNEYLEGQYVNCRSLNSLMVYIEQKYFPQPQPVKKVITIEVEANNIDWKKLNNNIKRYCDTCKHFRVYCYFDSETYTCGINEEPTTPDNTCEDWTTEEVELTEGEIADVAGDMEAHRRMVEGDDIE